MNSRWVCRWKPDGRLSQEGTGAGQGCHPNLRQLAGRERRIGGARLVTLGPVNRESLSS